MIPFSSYTSLACNAGFSLLSCGIGNNKSSQPEAFRSNFPLNSTTCQCYDYYGAKCVAWCYSGLVNNFQIVKNPGTGFLTGNVNTTCPPGSYVIGCHPNPYQMYLSDGYRKYYPSSSQTCTCVDAYGIQCVATCASNVRNYEIRAVTSTGAFQVVCSPSNAVLRCGMRTTGNGVDHWRTAFRLQLNSLPMFRPVRHSLFRNMRSAPVAAPGQGAPGRPPWQASAPPWLSPWLSPWLGI